ncbi:MAG: metallophosphoesterase family protein, partial [Candidatus Bathyarchaeia archaeon]
MQVLSGAPKNLRYNIVGEEKPSLKVGLLSDTHGHLPDEVLSFFSFCDVVFHAGSIGSEEVADRLEALTTLVAVYGNIDGREIR